MLNYRITPGSLMVRGGGFEHGYVITRTGVSDYATWINDATWDRGVSFPRPEDIFGSLGYQRNGQRSIFRWSAFHAAKML